MKVWSVLDDVSARIASDRGAWFGHGGSGMSTTHMSSLRPYFTCSDSVYYIPDFIPKELSESLCHHINHSITYKKLLNRELVSYGPMVSSSTKDASGVPVYLSHSIPLPSFMQRIIDSLHLNDIKKELSHGELPAPLNHILLNRYQSGQGILPHRDGPAYDPFVFILSLESPVSLDFHLDHLFLQKLPQDEQERIMYQIDNVHKIPHKFSLILEPNSLIIFHSVVYEYYKHGIESSHVVPIEGALNANQISNKYNSETEIKREQRSSLTIRTVKHVNSRVNRLFPGLLKK